MGQDSKIPDLKKIPSKIPLLALVQCHVAINMSILRYFRWRIANYIYIYILYINIENRKTVFIADSSINETNQIEELYPYIR